MRTFHDLDAVDVEILSALQEEGRMSWTRLAERIKMSAPSATERVNRLKERGYIEGFHARLHPGLLGHGTLGFVAVSVRDAEEHSVLLTRVQEIPEIQECHVVAGEYDYLLKIRCPTPEVLAELLRARVRSLPGVYRTNTIMVLEVVKESTGLPLPSVNGKRTP
jgi:Lrp/AsnC family leucine-responsive transcriptional regulator